MTLALLCPKCKSFIPADFMPPKAKLAIPAECPRCGDVEALIVETEPGGGMGKGWARAVEPTEEAEKEVELAASVVPAGGAIIVIGDTRSLLRFVLIRLLVFGAAFLAFGGHFSATLQDPYFLVAGSTVFLLLTHVGYVLAQKVEWGPVIKDYDLVFWPFITVVFFLTIGPLLVFEILLLANSLPFFLIDAAIAMVLFMLWRERQAEGKG